MKSKISKIRTLLDQAEAARSPRLAHGEVAAFEVRHDVALPREYREFLVEIGNGADGGPAYGLIPLGQIPQHWRRFYDFTSRLAKPFPLTGEWVWEDDDPEDASVVRRRARTGDGCLFLGEEGCGANWVLIVSGEARGEVWLATGEGMTPSRPRSGFLDWLENRLRGGHHGWASLVDHWGPHQGAYFDYHAARQALAAAETPKVPDPYDIQQSSPLCASCVGFFQRFAENRGVPVVITDPWHQHVFAIDGGMATMAAPAVEAGGRKGWWAKVRRAFRKS